MRGLGRVGAAAVLAITAAGAFAQADPSKVLRVVFPAAETGFDPQASSDVYSNHVIRAIFDAPYRYDHLARPYRIVPNTAVALPEISADGLAWTIRIKPGITFADDAAFKRQKRELTAADYVYSWKRVIDPKVRSPNLQAFDGLFVGADAAVAKAKETGRFDYDAPLEGLQAVDRHTIGIRLTRPAYDLLADLTTTPAMAVAREVIDAYGDPSTWAMANPVGTGPYRLAEWRRGQKIVLEANPGYREVHYPDSSDPADRAIVTHFKGKRLPLIGRIEIFVIEESNPRLLTFEKGGLDYLTVPADLVDNVLGPDNRLKPRFANAGVTLARGIQPAITYLYFNMEDPVVGGYTKDKVALRRAIGMAYNSDEEIRVLWQGQAVPATQPIPPGVTGHDPKFDGHVKYDLAGARALLNKFGYVDRDADGWRDLPDGKPFVLSMGSPPDARGSANTRRCGSAASRRWACASSSSSRNGPTCSRWDARASSRCGTSATSTRRPRATASSASCTVATRACRTSRASTCPSSTSSTRPRASCRTAPSARSCSARCRPSSRRTHRGISTSTATRT